MAGAPALAVYLPLLGAACVIVWRRPVRAVYAWIVGLAAHNAVMVLLYDAGVRGGALTVIGAWKETLLAVALARVARDSLQARSLPGRLALADVLAAAFALAVLVYALVPQRWLGGEAGGEAVAYGVRHALVPVAAYLLGRSLVRERAELRRLASTVVATAAAVAAVGIVELYAVSLDWWRTSGAPGWFEDQLGHDYTGLSGLPENFVFNDGDEHPSRRLVSTFLSPLASAYVLCVALLVVAVRPRRWTLAAGPLLVAALALTHTRAAFLALAGALCVLALVRRSRWPLAAAVVIVAVGLVSVRAFEQIAPETRFTPAEIRIQREQARRNPGVEHDPFSAGEPSVASHLRNLRDGLETVVRQPQGYGLGNAGATAERFGERPLAGESNYMELGVETGVIGLGLFVAWAVAVFVGVARAGRGASSPAWVAAALALLLALALQTDAVGIHWLAYVLWAAAGLALPAAAQGRAEPT